MCVRRARTHARSLNMAAHVRNATKEVVNNPAAWGCRVVYRARYAPKYSRAPLENVRGIRPPTATALSATEGGQPQCFDGVWPSWPQRYCC